MKPANKLDLFSNFIFGLKPMSGRCINLKNKFSMLVILQGLSLFQQFETFYMYFDLNTYVQKKIKLA